MTLDSYFWILTIRTILTYVMQMVIMCSYLWNQEPPRSTLESIRFMMLSCICESAIMF